MSLGFQDFSACGNWNDRVTLNQNLANIQRWIKFNVRVSGANFIVTAPDGTQTTIARAAALEQELTLFTATRLFNSFAVLNYTEKFLGTAGCSVTVGWGGDDPNVDAIIQSTDLHLDINGTQFNNGGVYGIVGRVSPFAGPVPVIMTFTSTSTNLSNLSSGNLDLWMECLTLP